MAPQFPLKELTGWIRIGAGFLVAKPPVDIVETSVQAPMINVNMSLGLP